MKVETYYEVQHEETLRIRGVPTRMWVRVDFLPRYPDGPGAEDAAVDRMRGLAELHREGRTHPIFRVVRITSVPVLVSMHLPLSNELAEIAAKLLALRTCADCGAPIHDRPTAVSHAESNGFACDAYNTAEPGGSDAV